MGIRPVSFKLTLTPQHPQGDYLGEARWAGGCAAHHGRTERRAFDAVAKLAEQAAAGHTIQWLGNIPAIEAVRVVEAIVEAAINGFSHGHDVDPFAAMQTPEVLAAHVAASPYTAIPADDTVGAAERAAVIGPPPVETLEAEAEHDSKRGARRKGK